MRIFLLGLVWWFCSGIAQPFFALAGIISIALALFAAHRFDLFKEPSLLLTRPLDAILYFGWLVKEMYLSAIAVTRMVWQVAPRPKPVLGWVETSIKDEASLALYGNSITLTPGTITAAIAQEKDRTLLLVHALELRGFKDAESGRMARKIARLFPARKEGKGNTSWW